MLWKRTLLIVDTAVLGLFTGAMLLIATALVPYWNSLTPELYRQSFQAIGPHLGTVMLTLLFSSILLTGVAVWADAGHRRWLAIAFAFVFAIIPLYGVAHAPANSLLLGASELSPLEIDKLRSYWALWHDARTLMGGVAFLLTLFTLGRGRLAR